MTISPATRQLESFDSFIGRRVHQLMWDRGLTQTAVAPDLGMTQSALARRLRGKLGWSSDQIADAARFFGVSVAYLFGEMDTPTPAGTTGGADWEPNQRQKD